MMFTRYDLHTDVVPGTCWKWTFQAEDVGGGPYTGTPLSDGTAEQLWFWDPDDSTVTILDASLRVTLNASSVDIELTDVDTAGFAEVGKTYRAWLIFTLDGEKCCMAGLWLTAQEGGPTSA